MLNFTTETLAVWSVPGFESHLCLVTYPSGIPNDQMVLCFYSLPYLLAYGPCVQKQKIFLSNFDWCNSMDMMDETILYRSIIPQGGVL